MPIQDPTAVNGFGLNDSFVSRRGEKETAEADSSATIYLDIWFTLVHLEFAITQP
jgi:hypothetical protein